MSKKSASHSEASSEDSEDAPPLRSSSQPAPTCFKKGYLKRKSTWSSWRNYFFFLKDGFLIEFSNATATKPRKVYNLDQYMIRLADKLTGQPNTFALISVGIARDPIYFQTTEKSDLIAWATSIQPFCHASSSIDWGENQFLEALNDPCVLASCDGTIIGVNSPFFVTYGYPKSSIIGANVRILMEDKFAVNHDSYLRRYAESGQGSFIGTARHYQVRHFNGTWIPSEISLGEMNSATDQPVSFLARFRLHQPAAASDEGSEGASGHSESDVPLGNIVSLTESHQIVTSHDDPTEALIHRFATDIQGDLIASLKNHILPYWQEQSATIESLRKKNLQLKRKIKRLQRQTRSARHELLPKSSSDLMQSSSSSGNRQSRDLEADPGPVVDTHDPEIGVKLAEGGSGAGVHIAHVDGWQCVVKELVITNLSTRTLTLFELELATLESLPMHRNLVRYLFHHRTPTKLQIFVTRYDTSLASHISQRTEPRRAFSVAETTKIMIDICRGVEQLHKRDIIHRDLKPDNIFLMLTRDSDISRCVVGDFDSAKRTQDQGAALTLVGTPGYIAPEVYTGERYGPACDIWSLGSILFELLTLDRPHKHLPISYFANPNAPGLQLDRSKFSAGFHPLIDLFDTCLHRDPLQRPSISDLIKSLVNHFCNL